MLAYKFTGPDGTGVFTGFRWPVPGDGAPGEWVRSPVDVDVCVAGVHACRVAQLPYWLAPELWEIELAGDVTESTYKLVAAEGRLLRRVEGWPAVERSFAEDCAARALGLAVSELRAAGLGAEADAAAAASTTAELATISDAVGARSPALVARFLGYAVDCSWDIDMGYFTMCAYVAATAFANRSTGDIVQDMSSDGWVQERSRQARWLADRLDLRDAG